MADVSNDIQIANQQTNQQTNQQRIPQLGQKSCQSLTFQDFRRLKCTLSETSEKYRTQKFLSVGIRKNISTGLTIECAAHP